MTGKATILSRTTKVRFPAGKYFIGDPCYCFGDESWREYGRQNDDFRAPSFITEMKGHTWESETRVEQRDEN